MTLEQIYAETNLAIQHAIVTAFEWLGGLAVAIYVLVVVVLLCRKGE